MARFALIENGVVKDIFDKDPRLPAKITVPVAIPDGEGFRHEMQEQEVPGWSKDLDIREIGKQVQSGWIVDDDGDLSPSQPASVPIAELPDALIRAGEQEPIEVSGVSVTIKDLEGLRNARDYLTMGAQPPTSVQWRSEGRSTPLNLAGVEAAISALVARQQRYYEKYAEVADSIDSGVATPRDIEKAFASI
jgi:hypothetical protein